MTPEQLAALVDRHGRALVLFARQWCSSPEDVVQESLMKLIELRVAPREPAAWLYRVVRNRALDQSKLDSRRHRRESAAQSASWFEESELQGLDVQAATKALQTLPAENREVIVARLWGELTFDQIAVVAGCSPSSAFRRFEAGMQLLRKQLGVPCPKNSIR